MIQEFDEPSPYFPKNIILTPINHLSTINSQDISSRMVQDLISTSHTHPFRQLSAPGVCVHSLQDEEATKFNQ